MSAEPWGQRINLNEMPPSFDQRVGDIVRWKTPAVGPVYDQPALDAAVAAARAEERERQSKLEAALWRLLDGSQHCGEMQWCGIESESPWEAARAVIRNIKPEGER